MKLSSLRRVTRDGQWVPEIDGLRFLAITSVVLFHLMGELMKRSGREIPVEPGWLWLQDLIGNGDRGVRLFFVISGMILALPFARHSLLGRKPVSLGRYYLRRVTRLEPPYLLSVAIFVLMIAVFTHGHPGPGFTGHALATAVYGNSLVYGEMTPVNPVTWSLEVEIQFYLLAPLFMLMFRVPGKNLRRALLLMMIVGAGLAQIPFDTGHRFVLTILYFVNYFLAGLLVADVWTLDLETMRTSWVWDGLGFGGLVLMLLLPKGRVAHIALPLVFVGVCLAAMRSVWFRRLVRNPGVAVIGGMCYSIYLLHFALIAVFFKATRYLIVPQWVFFANYAVQVVTVLVPVMVCAVLYFRFVEQPCMDPDWPSKLWHRLTGRSGQEAAALDSGGVTEG